MLRSRTLLRHEDGRRSASHMTLHSESPRQAHSFCGGCLVTNPTPVRRRRADRRWSWTCTASHAASSRWYLPAASAPLPAPAPAGRPPARSLRAKALALTLPMAGGRSSRRAWRLWRACGCRTALPRRRQGDRRPRSWGRRRGVEREPGWQPPARRPRRRACGCGWALWTRRCAWPWRWQAASAALPRLIRCPLGEAAGGTGHRAAGCPSASAVMPTRW